MENEQKKINSTYIVDLMKEYFSNHINSNASGRRSSILSPLIWFIGLSMTSILSGFRLGLPEYLLYVLITILIVGCILFLGAYIYSFFKSPDHLRSESFVITKMQIERGLTGDQMAGILEEEEKQVTKLISQESDGR